MLDFERLGDIKYVQDNIEELYDIHKALSLSLDKFKSNLKETWWTVSTNKYLVKVSTSNTLEPIDINQILERYPIDSNPNIYTIKLSKEACDIITEPDLFQEKPILSVLFTKNV